jgi:hypothetical protein
MGRRGWIYLRVVDGKGYCIGKTEDIARRDAEYSKENPFVETVCTFEVNDIDKVERALIKRTAHLRLLPNSKEWLHHTEEVVEVVELVRKRFALMTYAEWRSIVRERREKRLEQQKLEQQKLEQQKLEQQQAQPKTTTRPVLCCPRCQTRTAFKPMRGYVCGRCAFRFA